MNRVEVSVIIPTFRDWNRLQICIDAIARQSFPQNLFEVVIANNDPFAPPPVSFNLPTNGKLIKVIEPGSYAARNAGILASKGALLAFTDADCIPEPQWLIEAVSLFHSRLDLQRIAGGIELFVEDGIWTAAALYDRTFMLRQFKFSQEGKAATANAFMRREAFNKVGLFDPALLTGGDHEWSLRAEAAGLELQYCEKAKVKHPARSKFSDLLRKARRFTGGTIAKKRSDGHKLILPHFDNLLIPLRRGFLLFKTKDLTFSEAIRVWIVLYALRIAIVGEQVRLIIFRGKPERQ